MLKQLMFIDLPPSLHTLYPSFLALKTVRCPKKPSAKNATLKETYKSENIP
jgi:hypothetical protein